MNRRVAFFSVVLAASVTTAAVYVVRAARARGAPSPAIAMTIAANHEPLVLFRDLEGNEGHFGKVAMATIGSERAPHPGARASSELSCVRIHFAAGRGLCLEADDAVPETSHLHIVGPDLQPRASLSLNGIPSRARVARDGRYGAVTLFVAGHSYDDANMSTKTLLLDMAAGRVLSDLEQFAVYREGQRFESRDFNFWGVTFTRDSNRFFATLSSGGKTWLVRGDVAEKRVETVRENVECPSLSPDEKRIVFKKRVGSGGTHRLHALEIETLRERELGEEQPIDDQVEWLDDAHILYKNGPQIFALDVDGTSKAQVFLPRASSPAVVRPSR
ncbi:hypothetical protein [Pendulispora albinea]|uniref:Uncharacterized protein n=1 Tax=Pendulispora albinea TaxID=2741071 RepID=A0ABZ2LW99_9BACT